MSRIGQIVARNHGAGGDGVAVQIGKGRVAHHPDGGRLAVGTDGQLNGHGVGAGKAAEGAAPLPLGIVRGDFNPVLRLLDFNPLASQGLNTLNPPDDFSEMFGSQLDFSGRQRGQAGLSHGLVFREIENGCAGRPCGGRDGSLQVACLLKNKAYKQSAALPAHRHILADKSVVITEQS